MEGWQSVFNRIRWISVAGCSLLPCCISMLNYCQHIHMWNTYNCKSPFLFPMLLYLYRIHSSHRFSSLLEEGAGIWSPSNKKDELVRPRLFRATPCSSQPHLVEPPPYHGISPPHRHPSAVQYNHDACAVGIPVECSARLACIYQPKWITTAAGPFWALYIWP